MFVSPSLGGVTLLSLQLHMRVRMFECVYQVVGALFFFFFGCKTPSPHTHSSLQTEFACLLSMSV